MNYLNYFADWPAKIVDSRGTYQTTAPRARAKHYLTYLPIVLPLDCCLPSTGGEAVAVNTTPSDRLAFYSDTPPIAADYLIHLQHRETEACFSPSTTEGLGCTSIYEFRFAEHKHRPTQAIQLLCHRLLLTHPTWNVWNIPWLLPPCPSSPSPWRLLDLGVFHDLEIQVSHDVDINLLGLLDSAE